MEEIIEVPPLGFGENLLENNELTELKVEHESINIYLWHHDNDIILVINIKGAKEKNDDKIIPGYRIRLELIRRV